MVRVHLVFPLEARWLECRLDENATIAESVKMLGSEVRCVYDLERQLFVDPLLPVHALKLMEGTRLLVY